MAIVIVEYPYTDNLVSPTIVTIVIIGFGALGLFPNTSYSRVSLYRYIPMYIYIYIYIHTRIAIAIVIVEYPYYHGATRYIMSYHERAS